MGITRAVRIAVAAGLCVLAAAAPAAGQDGSSALRDYYSGNGLLNRGMYDLAAAEYRRFLQRHPEHERAASARYGLAVCLFRTGDHRGAAAELEALPAGDGFEFAAEAAVMLGQCRLALGEPEAAAASFGRALREHAGHDLADDAAALQAEALYEAGRYDEVDRPCRLLASRWPDSPRRPRAELFGGLADMARGDNAKAARRFEGMLETRPDGEYADRVTLLLAQSLHRSGAWPQAAEHYQRVIAAARDELLPDALYGLAVVSHRGGRHRTARQLLDRLLDDFPGDGLAPAARLLRGRARFDLGEYESAAEDLDTLARLDTPYRDDAEYWRAKCDLRRDRFREAATRLDAALRRFPDSDLVPRMTYDRAVALLRAGEPAEAAAAVAGFGSRHPGHELAPHALELEASALHRLERYGESLARCRAFEDRYHGHELAPSVAFLAAENAFLMKDYEGAADRYRAFLRDHPGDERDTAARYRLGLACYHRGAWDEARPWLEGVVNGRETEASYRPALLALGDAHFQSGRWEAAEETLADYVALGGGQMDDALLKLGLARRHRGAARSALRPLQRLVEEHEDSPHRARALYESGRLLYELKRPQEAAGVFEQVIAKTPRSPYAAHAMHHLGVLAVERGDDLDAAAHFGRAAEAFAGREDLAAEATFQQGQALVTAGVYDRAAETLARFASEHAAHERAATARALYAVSVARGGGGDRAGALAAIERAEAARGLDPRLEAALGYEKAWCLRELDRPQEAARAYRDVIGRGTDLADHARLELAEIEMDGGRYGEAATLLAAVHDAGADATLRARATYPLGVCAFRLQQYADAAGWLQEYLDGDPDPRIVPSASLLAAESLMQAGRLRPAVTHLARVVEQHPSDDACGPSLLRLGECRATLQEWSLSREAFETYLRRFPDSPQWFQARFGVGWAHENEGRHEEAIAAYRDVVDRHQGPTAARAQFQIGECLFARERYEEAVRELLKVDILYAYPEWSAAAIYEAGRCFQESGNPVDARKQYLLVQEQHAGSKWARMAGERVRELEETGLPGR